MPINNYTNNYSPTFKSGCRVYLPSGDFQRKILNNRQVLTETSPFRYGFDWTGFFDYMFSHFAGKNKINIHCLASSDGSEPYTFAIAAMDRLPESAYSKIKPIHASDIDDQIIKLAKNGIIYLDDSDLTRINNLTRYDSHYFVKHEGKTKIDTEEIFKKGFMYETSMYKPTEELRNMVEFKCSDMLTELKALNDEGNSVISISNVLPYLKIKYANEVIETLGEKLKSGSILKFASFDLNFPNLSQRLEEQGFFYPTANRKFVEKK